ncbi:MAG: 4'-phosphopantetheinyl transferase superfamily protein [Siphonobacter sp.]
MSLVWVQSIDSVAKLALWEITEEIEELRNQFRGSDEDLAEFTQITHPQKQREFLASRLLIQTLLEQTGFPYQGIMKDEFDKPSLKNTHGHFSLSHTTQWAAVVWHPTARVGLDIEPISEKLRVVAHKFLNESEFQHANSELERLAIYWTAKEALYKLHGQKKLSFKANIPIEPFHERADYVKGWLKTPDWNQPYDLSVWRPEGHILTVAVEG